MDENVKVWTPSRQEIHAERRGLDVKRFARQNRDIVRNMTIMVIMVLVACILTGWRTTVRLKKEFETQLRIERFQAEQEVSARMRSEYGVDEAEAAEIEMQENAKIIAKVLYPMANNKRNGLRSAVWCVLNRVDNPNYADDIYSVCSADQAFMGWSDGNDVVDRLYQIALHELKVWKSGVRPMSNKFVFLDWNMKEITLRDQFENRGAHIWTEEDWEEYDEAHGGY